MPLSAVVAPKPTTSKPTTRKFLVVETHHLNAAESMFTGIDVTAAGARSPAVFLVMLLVDKEHVAENTAAVEV